ncbi:MAG: hypothetical protein ACWA5A_14180 [Marinibacterium sp.]
MQIRHGRAAILVKTVIGGVVAAILWRLAFSTGWVGAILAGLAGGGLIHAFFGKVARATPDPPRLIAKADTLSDPGKGGRGKAPVGAETPSGDRT